MVSIFVGVYYICLYIVEHQNIKKIKKRKK